jgi:hypothetical protein
MKARLPESLLGRGKNAHPLHRNSDASASGNHFKPERPECLMRETLDVCVLFASTIAKTMVGGRAVAAYGRCRALIPNQ